MRRDRILFFLAGLAVTVGVVVLSRPKEPDDPEARVRAALDAAVSAAETQDLAGLLDVVSETFKGRGLDKQGLKGMLFVQLRKGSWRKVLLTGTEVSFPSPSLADVRTRALLARGEGLVPADADRWDLELTFSLEEDDAWRLVRASWLQAR